LNTSHNSTYNRFLVLLVICFFLIVNLISTGAHSDWNDGIATFVVTENMALRNSAMLHSDVPSIQELYGKTYTQQNLSSMPPPFYTQRSLLLSAVAVPFYYAAVIFSFSPVTVVAFFLNPLIIALTSLVIFFFLLELYASKRIAFVLSLVFNVCSFIWPYNTSLYPQPLQSLCIITAAFLIYKSVHHSYHHHGLTFICNYLTDARNHKNNKRSDNSNKNRNGIYFAGLGGLFLGLSVFAHPSSIIIIPGFIVYTFFMLMKPRNKKTVLISFLISLSLVLIFMGIVNYWRFGSFTEFGYFWYGSAYVHSGWEGLLGLWLSPGFGTIFYFPISVLLPLAIKYLYKENRWLFFLVVYIIIVNWLFVGTLSYDEPISWSGAFAWGPRYFIPILPFMILPFGTLLTHHLKGSRRLLLFALKLSTIILLCFAGFVVNLVGKLVWVSYVFIYMWDRMVIWQKAANYWNIVAWNPFYSPIVLHMRVLMDNYVSSIQPEYYHATFWHWATYGLAPCSYDLYIFCKFGLGPVLASSGVVVILGFLIMRNRYDILSFPIRNDRTLFQGVK
jgi:hypothetical protein